MTHLRHITAFVDEPDPGTLDRRRRRRRQTRFAKRGAGGTGTEGTGS